MIEIFAHRAIYENKENSLKGIEYNLKSGFNIEIDVREKHGRFYLSHDIQENGDSFYEACKIIKQNSKKAAIHIKEDFDIKNIVELIYEQNIERNCFIFSTLQNYDEIKKYENIDYAQYQNKLENNFAAKILWCDESNEKWYNENTFAKYKKNEKNIVVMSKELLKSCRIEEIKLEWDRLIALKVDAICTNFPLLLKEHLEMKGVLKK
jgi:glycerophosphoryl diester phosphodiesterase